MGPTPATPSSDCSPAEASLESPSALMSRPQGFSFRLIDAIHINRLVRLEHDGAFYWVKQRRISSQGIVPCANVFFKLAGNPIVVRARPDDWREWEISSYLLLHASEGFRAFSGADGSVWASELPGYELETPAKQGQISPAMLEAATRELRRAHRLPCPALEGEGWSHGDAHLANFIYDSTSNRARLIDFEVAHLPGMSTADRHADDLFVMIQSTMGYWPMEQWLTQARLILRTYFAETTVQEKADIIPRVIARLQTPTGVSRIWWAIRTDYLSASERDLRITALREVLRGTL